MARPSYGPQAKQGAKCLLETLLAYANNDLEDVAHLPIQVSWQTDRRLVVRTKIRFLEELIAINSGDRKLSNAQIKESLKRLQDFLGILEDNRPVTQGSEDWHFTLKLWFPRQEVASNLERFEDEWERLRPLRSKQVTGENSSSLIVKNVPEKSFSASPETTGAARHQDWGEALDVSRFYGRHEELTVLKRWIITDRCRLVTVLGMGGVGKTALSVKFAECVQDEFECLIWRSLRNAPPIHELLTDLIKFLAHQQFAELAETVDGKVAQLMKYLRTSRCLIVLDNVESVLHGSELSANASRHPIGAYRSGYEGYGQLFRCIGETLHPSCLILTSREKPRGIGIKEGTTLPARSLQLKGLTHVDGKKVLQDKGFPISDAEAQALVERYAGNPLALKIVATTIQELFDRDAAQFLQHGAMIFGDIFDLMEQQFNRLSAIEQQIMHWLAIYREWVSLAELTADLIPPVPQRTVLEALESLQQRSLIERQAGGFSQQPVVMDYVTERFIDHICREISIGNIRFFNSHALIKAQAKDYLRSAQVRLILQPIAAQLLRQLGSKNAVQTCLTERLAALKNLAPHQPGYAAGNLFNLLRHLQIDVSGYDFSNLAVWQALLQGMTLHRVNFARADLSRSVFTQMLGGILTAAFNPAGTLLATGVDQDISLWQVADGKQLITCKGHTGWVVSVTFSPILSPGVYPSRPQGILASGSHDQTVRLWDTQTGQCLNTLRGHQNWVQTVVFSPDGHRLASGSHDQTVRLWDAHTGQCLNVLSEHTGRVLWVAFTPDGQTLISASDDQTIRQWDVNTGHCLSVLETPINWVLAIALSPDGETLATGSEGKMVKLWNLKTGHSINPMPEYDSWVWAIAFSPDGHQLVTAAEDKTIKIWDAHTGTCLNTIHDHLHRVWLVNVSPDGQMLVSASDDQTVRLWDARTAQCLRTLKVYSNSVFAVAFSPDGQMLVTSNEDHQIRIWQFETEGCFNTLRGHTNLVMAVAFSPIQGWLATGSDDHTVKLWDVHTGECLKTFWGHTSWVQSVSFSLDERVLASASHDQRVKLWDVQTGECLQTLQGHIHRVKTVIFHPKMMTLVSGSDDTTLKIWDASSGICLQTLQGHTDWVLSVVYSPDGELIASGSGDRTIKIWNPSTGDCIQTLIGHTQRVRSVVFCGDRTLLASAGDDHTIKLWNAQTGNCLMTLQGHNKAIWSIAFNPKTQTLASGSEDETIRLWDIKTGSCIRTLRVERPYEGMNIKEAVGLTGAQTATLKALGAVEA